MSCQKTKLIIVTRNISYIIIKDKTKDYNKNIKKKLNEYILKRTNKTKNNQNYQMRKVFIKILI